MPNPLRSLADLWVRRYWKPDAAALAAATQGQPAIVITGASEGIGLALAHEAAADGHALVLIARRRGLLEAAAEEVRSKHGGKVIALPLDLRLPDAAERVEAALSEHGLYADVVMNNAGIGLGGAFTSHTPEEIACLVDLNMRALTLLCRRFLPGMLVRGRGGIINVASLGGLTPGPYQAAYYASKAYVISLTRAMQWETRGQGVRIAVVSPGPVATRFHAKMGADAALYRWMVPGMSAEAVARAAWRGWRWGFGVILPGLFSPGLALAMKLLPGMVIIPIIGFLLRIRLRRAHIPPPPHAG